MKNNELQKPDTAGRICEAMAMIRQGQKQKVPRPPVPEIFDLYCVCAVLDKPYTLRFVRQSSGLLRFRESLKAKPSSLPDNARAGGVGWTLRLSCFESGPTPCAWCGNASFHHCGADCGALVCGGRMKGETFHCRPSCGASWVGIPLDEVSGNSATEFPRLTAPLAERNLSAPRGAVARKVRLLLPAAKTGGQ